MTNYALARQLWEAFGKRIPDEPTVPSDEDRRLAARLILEEAFEVVEAITGIKLERICAGENVLDHYEHLAARTLPDQDLVATAHELADLLVVTYGAGATHGFPVDDVYAEVCLSDLTKADGERRPDGKVTREGSSYQPPDVARILEDARTAPPSEGATPPMPHLYQAGKDWPPGTGVVPYIDHEGNPQGDQSIRDRRGGI